MRYRQREFFPDEPLATMLASVSAEIGNGSLELVFNGDLFDFDVAPVVDGEVLLDGRSYLDAPSAAARLDRILDDHPIFLDAVARVLLDGHRVVFISGNHDAQLAFPAVRAVVTRHLLRAARGLDRRNEHDHDAIADRIAFRTWFHRTRDGVHIEHGNQYDRYCSFQLPTEPLGADGRVQPTVGALVMQHIMSRLGYMNPNVDSTFLLSFPEYLSHWARFYALSKHSLALTWALGAVRVAFDVLRADDAPTQKGRVHESFNRYAAELGVSPDVLESHAKLFVRGSVHDAARILCLDRAAIAAMATAAGALALANPAAGAFVGASAMGAAAVLHAAAPDSDLATVYGEVQRAAREIAKIHDARAVVFGHTHQAGGVWEDGRFYGNSGTWAPAFLDAECMHPVEEARPLIWLQSDPRTGTMLGGLYRYRHGMLRLANGEQTTRGTVRLPESERERERAPMGQRPSFA